MNSLHRLLIFSALALVVAGCGGGGSKSSSPAADSQIRDQAAAKIEKAAAAIVAQTPDKHLPGPKNYKVVCLEPGQPGSESVPENAVKCHVEAFYDPYRGSQGGYIWSEDWTVPVVNGKVGEASIAGEYRIQNFLRLDNRKNCTGRHRPQECLPADAYAPPDQTGGTGQSGQPSVIP